MKFSCVSAVALWGITSFVGAASAQEVAALHPATRSPAFMRVFGNAQPPYGFIRFCEEMPGECAGHASDDARLDATPERLSELDEVNRGVNQAIEPATDMEVYGVSEYWTIPTNRGDCEDFALLKRKDLIERGWPARSLPPRRSRPSTGRRGAA